MEVPQRQEAKAPVNRSPSRKDHLSIVELQLAENEVALVEKEGRILELEEEMRRLF